MSEATSILDLPTDPIGGNTNNNIGMKAQENTVISSQQPVSSSSGMSLDQTTINQIVNGLQQAKLAGATQLPSRDIPMNTVAISNDPQVNPNYVPSVSPHQNDYVGEQTYYSNKQQKNNNSLDEMYNEIQMPLLMAVLYFLFQLPFFKKFMYSNLSFLFSNDGNYNINGYLFISILFGILFHFLMKITKYFGAF